MGKLILKCFCLFAVIGNLSIAFGWPIEIVSQEYHVWGSIVEESYDITSNTPISGICKEYVSDWGGGWITQSSSTLGSTIDFISLDASSWSEYPYGGIANAEVIYVFKPTDYTLQIQFIGQANGHYFTNSGYFTLEELGNGTALDSRTWNYEYGLGWVGSDKLPYYGAYDVSLINQYKLTIGVSASVPDFRHETMHLEAAFVPEPASVILAGIAVPLLLVFARRFRREGAAGES